MNKKILIYLCTLFAQFFAQCAEKEHKYNLYSRKYNKPAYLLNPNKKTQFMKAQNKLLAMHANVKTQEICVSTTIASDMLPPGIDPCKVRLRRRCTKWHNAMENLNSDLLSRMNNIT